MIPLRDTIRSYSTPIVTYGLIGANVLAFLFELSLRPAALNRLIATFGVVPARLNLNDPAALLANPLVLITLFTHMFLHGGWFHLLSNLWILFIFGDNVEDRMGSGRFLAFYLLSGIAAGLLQAGIAPDSAIPAIGASGAIAGVLGAYIVLFPGARVVSMIPIFLVPWFVEVTALVYLGIWFVSQLFSGLLSLPNAGQMGGVAWWAHIGGFVFGALAFRLFLRPRHETYRRAYPDEYSPN